MNPIFEEARVAAGPWRKESDALFPEATWRFGQAALSRRGELAASWTLARLSVGPTPSRVFVLPTGSALFSPASLWISNLRQSGAEQGFCSLDDVWVETLRSGWASYDFNAIQERSFTLQGGAIEGLRAPHWPEYAAATLLPETLLCALPWDGLAAMWGPLPFSARMAERERLILERDVSESQSGSGSGKGRSKRKALKV